MKHVLNNKEQKEIIALFLSNYNLSFSKKDKFEREDNILLINNEPLFFYYENKIGPTLKTILKNNFLKKIIVDMGAVKFVVSGADIMRPGIKKIDDNIAKEEIVAIVDETHSKPLAIGLTLFSGEEIQKMGSGKAVKNLHYVGDKVWNYH